MVAPSLLKRRITACFWVLFQIVTLTIVTTSSIQQQSEVTLEGDFVTTINLSANFTYVDTCQEELLNLTLQEESSSPLDGISFAIHRNGETKACGAVKSDIEAMRRALVPFENKCYNLTKYDLESFLTLLFANQLGSPKKCKSKEKTRAAMGFYGYCDRGPDRTAELMDYDDLVRVPNGSLPCRYFTREGVRIKSLLDLAELARKSRQMASHCNVEYNCESNSIPELHLYAVPASRVFMFAPMSVGEIFDLPHIQTDTGLPVSLEVLSVNPRVFDVKNFFSNKEAGELIQEALSETRPEFQLKRSYTGFSQDNMISTRTSESGWLTESDLVIKIVQRAFRTVGFEDARTTFSDGIQVLRYNKSKAYGSHVDFIIDPDDSQMFDYDSAKKGGNRYATILLYLSEMNESDGGETVFSEAWPPLSSEEDRIPLPRAIEQLRESGDAKMLEEGSWEEEMVATCRARLAVRPTFGRAILFYSQHPDGHLDKMSTHGGCPVLNGIKWAANVWLYNTPIYGIKAPLKKQFSPFPQQHQTPKQLYATFSNSGKDVALKAAGLYYEDTFWGGLGHGDPPLSVHTYPGHKWNVKVGDQTVKTFIIGSDDPQEYVI